MTLGVRVLERITRVAPFGVQFRDSLSASLVRDGLQVALHPAREPERRVYAQPNASGVYVVHEAPGLDYRCEVSDAAGRFLPVSLAARLPHRGLFVPECASPPAAQDAVALFSAPTRLLSGACAVVRAELVDAATGKAAAWTRIVAEHLGQELGAGVADRAGRLLLAFAYPEPQRRPRRSPPEPESEPPGALMSWEIGLRAYYDPALGAEAAPDYCALLAQPQARLLEAASPAQPLDAVRIVLGRESVYPRLLVEPV